MRTSPDSTTAVGGGSEFACSQVQVGIWLAERLGAGSRYHMPLALWLRGRVDIDLLNAAFHALLARHTLLLSCYPAPNGGPGGAPFHGDIPTIEDVPEAESSNLAAILRDRTTTPFDVTRGPLLRAALIRLGDDLSLLHLVFHHLVFDGVSRDIVVRDLAACYNEQVGDEPSELGPLPDYGRYVDAERSTQWSRAPGDTGKPGNTEDVGDIDDAADRTELSDCFVGAMSAAGSGVGAEPVEVTIGPGLRSRLAAVAAAAGVTVHTALLTSFAVVLHKYCSGTRAGLPGLAIPMNARPPEFADCVGPFVNERVLLLPSVGEATFRGLLPVVAEGMRRLMALRTVPAPGGGGTGGITFGYRRLSSRPITMVGLDVDYQPVLPRYGTGRELEVQLLDDGTQLTGWVDFDPQRFDTAMVQQLADHWLVAIGSVVSAPDRSLAELGVLRPAERRTILRDWNATDKTWPGAGTISGLFQAQVQSTPEAIAVLFTGGQLTYAELNRRANRLAHRLGQLGVGPESLVAICAERSPELVVALLGVLKAGAAYVPLDPEYPPVRLAHMLSDSAPAALLTQRRLSTILPQHAATTLLLDDPQTDTGQPEHNPAVPIQTGSAAYAIYTSGSTGTPKAAVTSHESLRNLLLWMQDAYPLRASDRVLQKTPSSFDVSVWEFFWPLVCGAGLVLARPGGHRDGGYLARLINRTQVTTLHFVPSMLRAFLDEPDLETSCGSLRDVICIGEELPADLVRRFTGRLDARLHNLYGPTEATIEVSAYTCRRDEPGPRVPIGVPIANTEWYVLDPDYQPVPVGVTGELHLGGIGLARGYLRRPGLTADRFVPDPFGNGSRLYRTGDLARYRADGSVDFLGRADQQVKIRGQRIEPAEIEAALRGQTGVGDAAVLARASDRGETELVAYVVPAGTDGQEGEADGQPLSEAALLTGLRRCLADAMIPSAVVVLDALPLTPNGKLDRKGLPSPPLTDRPYVAPRTAVELAIADIWADVFAMDRISVEDDFFALGGESLLATRTLARVRSTLGVELPLRVIFDRPTVGGLAAAVVAADRDEQ